MNFARLNNFLSDIAKAKQKLMKVSPFLTCLDFGVCEAIRLVRFGYNTFTECVV